jgi:hypothetical protein
LLTDNRSVPLPACLLEAFRVQTVRIACRQNRPHHSLREAALPAPTLHHLVTSSLTDLPIFVYQHCIKGPICLEYVFVLHRRILYRQRIPRICDMGHDASEALKRATTKPIHRSRGLGNTETSQICIFPPGIGFWHVSCVGYQMLGAVSCYSPSTSLLPLQQSTSRPYLGKQSF